jgi:hypothetical protein
VAGIGDAGGPEENQNQQYYVGEELDFYEKGLELANEKAAEDKVARYVYVRRECYKSVP